MGARKRLPPFTPPFSRRRHAASAARCIEDHGDCGLAIVYDTYQREAPQRLPLLGAGDPARVVAWCHGEPLSAADFPAQVHAVAASLPAATAAVKLDRKSTSTNPCH